MAGWSTLEQICISSPTFHLVTSFVRIMSLQSYLDLFVQSLKKEDGSTIAELISYSRPYTDKLSRDVLSVKDFSARVGNRKWSDVIAAHLKVYRGYIEYVNADGEDNDDLLVAIATDQISLAQFEYQFYW